jgi:hypothetical protein
MFFMCEFSHIFPASWGVGYAQGFASLQTFFVHSASKSGTKIGVKRQKKEAILDPSEQTSLCPDESIRC